MELPKKMKIKTINRLTLIFTFLVLLFTSIGYSALSANLKISGDVDFNYDPGSTLADVFTTDNPLIIEYQGDGWVGGTNPYFTNHIYHWFVPKTNALNNSLNGHTIAENVATIKNNWNVVFGGYCWQMIRTTENGGVKLLYNGEPIVGTSNGETTYYCGDNRPFYFPKNFETEKLLAQRNFGGNRLYGSGYTTSMSGTTTTFTLTDTITSAMNSSTINNLKGMYTCGNTTGTCTNLSFYKINSLVSGNTAKYYIPTYYDVIGEYEYFEIGKGKTSNAGYMNNVATADIDFESAQMTGTSNTYKFTNTITYNTSTKKYTLNMSNSNTSVSISDFTNTTQTKKIGRSHYVCLQTAAPVANTTTCDEVGYVFDFYDRNDDQTLYYVVLSNGKYVSTDTNSTSGMTKWADNNNILYSSLYKVNNTSSNIKLLIDEWYEKKFLNTSYESLIDGEEIYCNDRSTRNNFGSWNLNASDISTDLYFIGLGYTNVSINGNSTVVYNISCPNKLDAFSKTSTTKGNGALTYPIALLSYPEAYNLGSNTLREHMYWLNTPSSINLGRLHGSQVNDEGAFLFNYIGTSYGVRPSIALKSTAKFSSGDGSMANPYVVYISS